MKKNLQILSVLGFLLISLVALRVEAQEKLSPNAMNCLKQTLGEQSYNQIINGERPATAEEKNKGKSCLSGMIKQDKKIEVKKSVKQCIQGILGQSETEGIEPTEEQHQRIEKECFKRGDSNIISFPDETKTCIASVVGKERAGQFVNSDTEPTEEEKRTIGPKCFGMKPPPEAAEMERRMPPEVRECIKNTLGKTLTSPPTEEERALIDQKCFGGEDRMKGREGMKEMNDEKRECFKNVVGKYPNEMAGRPTADQEQALGQCFGRDPGEGMDKNEGDQPNTGNGSQIEMSEEQKRCFKEILGKEPREMGRLSDEQKGQVSECFSRQGSQGDNERQQSDQRNMERREEKRREGFENQTGSGMPNQSSPTNTPSTSGTDPLSGFKPEIRSCIASALGISENQFSSYNFSSPSASEIVGRCRSQYGS